MSIRPHTVAAVVTHDVSPFELSVACEVFGLDRSELVDPWYRFMVCSVVDGPLRTKSGGGMTLVAPHRLADLADADTVVVPMWRVDDVPPDELLEAIRAAHARGARIMSFCSGAFVLAHAGLLDGRRATTHWMFAERLAARFPQIHVEPNVLYVIDDDGVMTSAGTAAAIDLCLQVVRTDHGAEVANAVARRMVVPPHRDGGQAQFIQAPVAVHDDHDPFRGTLEWALEHLDEPLTVEVLARRAATSPRTFARRFVATTGTTPLQWLLRQRVLLAQRLLETTDEPVERIARRCGFGTAAGLRTHFQRQVGTSPQAYRRTFATSSPPAWERSAAS